MISWPGLVFYQNPFYMCFLRDLTTYKQQDVQDNSPTSLCEHDCVMMTTMVLYIYCIISLCNIHCTCTWDRDKNLLSLVIPKFFLHFSLILLVSFTSSSWSFLRGYWFFVLFLYCKIFAVISPHSCHIGNVLLLPYCRCPAPFIQEPPPQ